MLSTAGSVALETRKGRTATVQPFTNLLNSSAKMDSVKPSLAQCTEFVPRIIALHWLRPGDLDDIARPHLTIASDGEGVRHAA